MNNENTPAMDAVDEELGEGVKKVVSFRDVDDGADNDDDEQDNHLDGNGELLLASPTSISSPADITELATSPSKGLFGSLLGRRFAQHNNLDSSERSLLTSGKWKSLGSDRRIRFGSHRSDAQQDHELRGIVATPLDSGQGVPMDAGARFFKNIRDEVATETPGFLRFGSSVVEGGGDGGGQEPQDGLGLGLGEGVGGGVLCERPSQMYRLTAVKGANEAGFCRRIFQFIMAIINCGALTESDAEQNLYFGCGDPNRWLMSFFFWLFRKGWTTVIMLSVFWYYTLIVMFALFIMWASDADADCVKVGGNNIGELENRSKFVDSFSLSWNTFSTVGYGSTYPALSMESGGTGGDERCAFINFLTSLEAFVGVIFAGFIGAIFFAKVARITQRADVRFSDPLTVRFGSGVNETKIDDDEDCPEDRHKSNQAKKQEKVQHLSPLDKFRSMVKKVSKPSPFPVMTFRIANEMQGKIGGEIIGANVKAVVLIESTRYDDQVCDELAKQIAMDRMRRATKDTPKLRKGTSKRRLSVNGTERSTGSLAGITDTASSIDENSTHSFDRGSSDGSETNAVSTVSWLQGLNTLTYKGRFGAKKMKIDDEEEGSGSKIVPRMVFTKLELETSEHPLFQRIWRFKHHINQDSPLLTLEAQRTIMENHGKWPHQWNNPEAVRKAIRFNQMVVSFTGISNVSGASVYKQKVYDYVDTVVGYQFVNALYRGRRGNLKVDLSLINDVKEQDGGRGEELNLASKKSPAPANVV